MNKYIKPMCPECNDELILSVPVHGQRELRIGKNGKSLKCLHTSSLDEGDGELYCNICNRGYSYTWDKKNRIILEEY